MPENQPFDALILVSFGGPDGPDDVMPFLENVLRGRRVPRERMLEVAEHYQHFGGASPINAQNKELIAAIKDDFSKNGIDLPIYWGNRNWHPMIDEALTQMNQDGVKKALAFFTSMFSCYSGCRQYRENIADAQNEFEDAPEVHKVRMAYNHPLFIEACADRVKDALGRVEPDRRAAARVTFTAHSIPISMSETSHYARQLQESARLVMESIGDQPWDLVYQSRSGPPMQPWLEPDICDHIQAIHDDGFRDDLIIMPLGFVSDHMEVMFDLDTEAQELCDELSITMVRAGSVGVHPLFIQMIRELVLERTEGLEKRAIGQYPPNWDVCPKDCCKSR
ncbi:MAG: ferrochelatase [Planctomycetota bacterium]